MQLNYWCLQKPSKFLGYILLVPLSSVPGESIKMSYLHLDFVQNWIFCEIRRHGRLFSFHNVQNYIKEEGRTRKQSRKEKQAKKTPLIWKIYIGDNCIHVFLLNCSVFFHSNRYVITLQCFGCVSSWLIMKKYVFTIFDINSHVNLGPYFIFP